MATHSSILAWRIPWTKEPGRLWFMGSQRVRHDWSNLTRMHMHARSSSQAFGGRVDIPGRIVQRKQRPTSWRERSLWMPLAGVTF